MMPKSYTTTTVTGAPFSPGPTTTVVETFTFTDAGALLVRGFQSDETGDGKFDSASWTYNTLDGGGRVVGSVIADDWTGDAIPDTFAITRFAYDPDGQAGVVGFEFVVPGTPEYGSMLETYTAYDFAVA